MSSRPQLFTPEALVKIKANYVLGGRLMAHFNVHYKTILRWFESNNPMLTTPEALDILEQETKLSRNKMLVSNQSKRQTA